MKGAAKRALQRLTDLPHRACGDTLIDEGTVLLQQLQDMPERDISLYLSVLPAYRDRGDRRRTQLAADIGQPLVPIHQQTAVFRDLMHHHPSAHSLPVSHTFMLKKDSISAVRSDH